MVCMPSDMVRDFSWFQGRIALPGDTVFRRICVSDPTRVAIILGGNFVRGYYWSTYQSPTNQNAMAKSAQANETILTFKDVGPLVTSEFWLADDGAAENLSWIEVYYRPAVANPQ